MRSFRFLSPPAFLFFAKVTRRVLKVALCDGAANKAATVALLKTRRSTQKSFTVPLCSLPSQVFKPRTPPEAIALCSRLLEYTPVTRLSPLEACAHAFFEELRQPNTRLPSGRELPLLFNFSPVGQFSCAPLRSDRGLLSGVRRDVSLSFPVLQSCLSSLS